MVRKSIECRCHVCEYRHTQKPTRSPLGFLRVECPLCRAPQYGPLPAVLRVIYWTLFSGLGLLILNDVDALLREATAGARGHHAGSLAGAVLWALPVAWALFRDHELTTQSSAPHLGGNLRTPG